MIYLVSLQPNVYFLKLEYYPSRRGHNFLKNSKIVRKWLYSRLFKLEGQRPYEAKAVSSDILNRYVIKNILREAYHIIYIAQSYAFSKSKPSGEKARARERTEFDFQGMG